MSSPLFLSYNVSEKSVDKTQKCDIIIVQVEIRCILVKPN